MRYSYRARIVLRYEVGAIAIVPQYFLQARQVVHAVLHLPEEHKTRVAIVAVGRVLCARHICPAQRAYIFVVSIVEASPVQGILKYGRKYDDIK